MEQEAAAMGDHAQHPYLHPPTHHRPGNGDSQLRTSHQGRWTSQTYLHGVRRHSCSSFGFQQEFDISPTLYGKIQQDGLTFELYVNGESFTSLSQKEYGYGILVIMQSHPSWK